MHLNRLRHRGKLTLGEIVRYLVPGMVGNIRIDEYTLLDFYNETVSAENEHGHEHIHPDIFDEDFSGAIANFSQTWSRRVVDEFTFGQVLFVLFRTKIDLEIQRFIGGSIK